MSEFSLISDEVEARYGFLSVRSQRWTTPDGEQIDRLLVGHPGAAVIVPVVDGRALCVRQFRTSVGRNVLEVPAGKLDPGDRDPLTAAQRELLEETGRTAQTWVHLSSFLPSPGFCDEVMHCYLATDLGEVAEKEPDGPEEAAMTEQWVDLGDVPAMIASGDIEDAKTIIGLLLAGEQIRSDGTGR